jgi:peptidoglycan/LPS O-acetylase OafA/YrhL
VTYRPDIDGLRAIAVIAVLLYHLEPAWCSGGFVGVDVFFVISGYLITHILWRRVQDGTFSLLDFFRRRVRRLFPALFAMLLIQGILGLAFLSPPELARLGESIAASASSVSNLYFWSQTDYFGSASEQRWLLHTWSLGVEEQFYLTLPLVLSACAARLARARRVLSVLALISLISSAYMVQESATDAFYLPHARAWELLTGSLLALGVLRFPNKGIAAQLLAAGGAVALTYSIVAFSWRTAFPGPWALVPCLGTAALIGTGPGTVVARVLALRPLVALGLVSYSLYLWHWPLIVWWDHPAFPPPSSLRSDEARIGCLLLGSIAAGVLSWRLVEQPFRSKMGPLRQPLRQGLATAGLAVMLGLGLSASGGLPGRTSPEVATTAAWAEPERRSHNRMHECFITSESPAAAFAPRTCLGSNAGGLLLLGDSHGAHLYEGLRAAHPGTVHQATASGCRPGLPLEGHPRCVAVLETALAHAETAPPSRVVLAARWTRGDVGRLRRMLRHWRARGIPVTLVGRTVEYTHDLPLLLAYEQAGRRGVLARSRRTRRGLDLALKALAASEGADFVSLQDLLCDGKHCRVRVEDTPLQFDYGHFTSAGSRWVATRILAADGP